MKDEKDFNLAWKFLSIIKELNLFDVEFVTDLIKHPDFIVRKMGVTAASCDKPFYNRNDIAELENLTSLITEYFPVRGQVTSKKQLLSSKEKKFGYANVVKQQI